MITVLKGSPSYSIDKDNIMHITTTWIVMPDVSVKDNIVGWLNFQSEVEEWAGAVGDAYKAPVLAAGEREVTTHDESSAFIVTSISYSAVEGRTHYEVTFEHTQNFNKMQQIGNVSVDINSNNEKSKTIQYRVYAGAKPKDIDSLLIESGTEISWASKDFLVETSSYTPSSVGTYDISITAIDMSYMMIGQPTYTTDGFGNKSAEATWRMSTEKYADWDAPSVGSDAGAFLNREKGYIVTGISAQPVGVLGYMVTISAKYVGLRQVTQTVKRDTDSNSHTITYQSNKENIHKFMNIVGMMHPNEEKIRSVDIQEDSRGDYRVTVNTSTDVKDVTKEKSVTATQGKFVLDATMCGWANGESGELYPINNPPKTKFTMRLNLSDLRDRGLDDKEILSALKPLGYVGMSTVLSVYASKDGTVRQLDVSERSMLKSADIESIVYVIVSTYVYSQPVHYTNGKAGPNPLFTKWARKDSLPMYYKKKFDDPADSYTDEGGTRDKELPRKYVGKSFTTTEISVSMSYKMPLSSALLSNYKTFYDKAIALIDNDNFTSYKGAGINMNTTYTPDGNTVVKVTCEFVALSSGYWNPDYENTVYVYNK